MTQDNLIYGSFWGISPKNAFKLVTRGFLGSLISKITFWSSSDLPGGRHDLEKPHLQELLGYFTHKCVQTCHPGVFVVADYEGIILKVASFTWRWARTRTTSSTGTLRDFTLKCVQIRHLGVFGIADYEDNILKVIWFTWRSARTEQPHLQELFRYFTLKCVQIRHSAVFEVAEQYITLKAIWPTWRLVRLKSTTSTGICHPRVTVAAD